MMAIVNKPRSSSRFPTLPHSVEAGIIKLGQNLRAARLRRNLSIEDVAARIGISRFVVADAEKGKPTTGIAVYAALLWTYRMLDQLVEVAGPTKDSEGAALSLTRERARTSRPQTMNNDF
jgi:transcriptional regulator with XRE-family HTH domain